MLMMTMIHHTAAEVEVVVVVAEVEVAAVDLESAPIVVEEVCRGTFILRGFHSYI